MYSTASGRVERVGRRLTCKRTGVAAAVLSLLRLVHAAHTGHLALLGIAAGGLTTKPLTLVGKIVLIQAGEHGWGQWDGCLGPVTI